MIGRLQGRVFQAAGNNPPQAENPVRQTFAVLRTFWILTFLISKLISWRIGIDQQKRLDYNGRGCKPLEREENKNAGSLYR